tara:strand:+ start:4819 stop:5886 length:1068 start_codon:yes stop_codon:yes gene_type:complete
MEKTIFKDKTVLITGGTGSLGKTLLKRLLSKENDVPKKIILFSRDEAKQHSLRQEYLSIKNPTDEVIYNNFNNTVSFIIGDVRNYNDVVSALRDVDIVLNTAALKQVPSCEYFPYQAIDTNLNGPNNIVNAINNFNIPVETVVGISTDKACQPINVMGMTKALQEKIFLTANLTNSKTRYICVRYGNVLASRGSVIPLFLTQIQSGGPITITDERMTRFLLSLNNAVDLIFNAILKGNAGETFIPIVPSAKMTDLAKVLIGDRDIEISITGIRPGEKIHESLISAEEMLRAWKIDDFTYVINSVLPELVSVQPESLPIIEYSSKDDNISTEDLYKLLESKKLLSIKTFSNSEILA